MDFLVETFLKISGPEWALISTGDYALEYALFYYLKLPNTKVTRTIRRYLYQTKFDINKVVYQKSISYGVDLATPLLLQQTTEV